MRRALSLGILACLLISTLPFVAEDSASINNSFGMDDDLDFNDNVELTDEQKESLKASGLGRSASSNWSATGGSFDDDEIYEMVFDSDGNVIVCGTIFSTSQFGIQFYTLKVWVIFWWLNYQRMVHGIGQ